MEITVEDLSLKKLQNTPITEFRYHLGGRRDAATTTVDGHLMAEDGNYKLMMTTYRYSFTLENGVQIKDGAGWVIFEKVNNNLLAVNFISAGSGYGWAREYTYSGIPEEFIQNAVDTWNSTIEGQEVETPSDVDDRTDEFKAAAAAQAERLREEAKEKEKEKPPLPSPSIKENKIIREETTNFVFEYSSVDEDLENVADQRFVVTLQIWELTRGTEENPSVSYKVVQRYPGSENTVDAIGNTQWTSVSWEQNFETQEEAEEAFDNRLQSLEDNFMSEMQEVATSQAEEITDRQVSFVDNSRVEFYLGELNVTLKEAIESSKYDGTIFWTGSIDPGAWNDASYYSGSGKTLYLSDFDTPRFTTEGYKENKSGAVKIVMNRGFKAEFELETDSDLSFIRNAQSDISSELISRDGTQFDFALYGGDRIEIDIDNERDNVRPFLVTVQGTEWYSAEEADDEITLYMNPDVEVLMARVITDKGYRNAKGELYSGDIDTYLDAEEQSIIEAPATTLMEAERFSQSDLETDSEGFRIVTYTVGPSAGETETSLNSISAIKTYEVMGGNFAQLVEDYSKVEFHLKQEVLNGYQSNAEYSQMMETITSDNREVTSKITQEDSFTSAEELVIEPAKELADDAADAAGEAIGGVWDSIKWWVVGGVIFVGAVVLIGVYLNARGRSAAQSTVTGN